MAPHLASPLQADRAEPPASPEVAWRTLKSLLAGPRDPDACAHPTAGISSRQWTTQLIPSVGLLVKASTARKEQAQLRTERMAVLHHLPGGQGAGSSSMQLALQLQPPAARQE